MSEPKFIAGPTWHRITAANPGAHECYERRTRTAVTGDDQARSAAGSACRVRAAFGARVPVPASALSYAASRAAFLDPGRAAAREFVVRRYMLARSLSGLCSVRHVPVPVVCIHVRHAVYPLPQFRSYAPTILVSMRDVGDEPVRGHGCLCDAFAGP